ncbi:2873_t:CDS:2 [Funneliformis geosporum]|uniref:13140_t:CDS:1 n=1 Tax=Funneliformis geosporum TaxID=1117311 RepID=A0A9W4SRG0_9GLOM|nr:2873_t:CDS:2 [Funneliformis geosporum]CAI2180156.1 13140_t:CDS:2 [Funneliformis geosporum]
MSLRCGQLLAIIFAACVLGAITLSFSFVKVPKIEPEPDRLTGYPTWHGVFKGIDNQKKDSMTAFISIVMLVVGVIGLKLVINPPTKPSLTTKFYTVSDDPNDDNQESISGVPTIGLNRSLVIYTLVTCVTSAAALIVDIGKLWSVIGLFHNSFELVTLLLIGGGGRIKSVSYLVWIIIYIVSVGGLCIFSDFPNDAFFFKIQGLCFDYALVIEFVRIYITTKKHLRDAGNDTLPLNSEEIDDDDNIRKLLPDTFNHHPKQIIFLILASGAHLFGNLWSTFFVSSANANLIFGISYAITFPLYILYVYVDTQATSVIPQKRIYLPYTPTWKVIVISIYSLALSLLTLRLSVLIPTE